jgi:uncharacterized FAD-dependent dehydrogenase
MLVISEIHVNIVYNNDELIKAIAQKVHINYEKIKSIKLCKRAVDARKKDRIQYVITAEVEVDCQTENAVLKKKIHGVSKKTDISNEIKTINKYKGEKRPIIVGFGPAGMFAGLVLAESGAKPIIIERGKQIDERTVDVRKFIESGILDCNSNIQYGEGGAGTFSDGKLNTGIKDVRIKDVIRSFVDFGAPEEILYEAKPHIGTDYLPRTVAGIRNKIISLGGSIEYNTKLENLIIERNRIAGIVANNDGKKKEYLTDAVILASGQSSEETVAMLIKQGINVQPKPFSVGVRIEHLASMINTAQYGKFADKLPPADYKMAIHLNNNRGVYTFCMCPGGSVVAATSKAGHIVTNGMSNHSRSGINSNAAILVGITPADFESDDPLAGYYYRDKIEEKAFEAGGADYSAVSEKVGDFLNGELSDSKFTVLPSYKPSVVKYDIGKLFPNEITESLKQGIIQMGKIINGFDSGEAVITAPETRSSSPVRIIRDDNMMASNFIGLFPCGEGAGYAGGITSSAVDGIKCAEALIRFINTR